MKTEKTMLILVIGLLLFGNVSALYSGECSQVELNFDNLDNIVYTVVNNQSNLEGLNLSIEGNLVNICPVKNYKPDNFTLIFWDNTPEIIKKEVIVYRGRGSKIKYVYENITKYIEVEKIKYINQTVEKEIQVECPKLEQRDGFFKRIWNWIIKVFSRH